MPGLEHAVKASETRTVKVASTHKPTTHAGAEGRNMTAE
eukprot:CAMPEP_0171653096 /NCGR_PEP_ID=MMETSP0990-20121206/39349_1 /TAXON_ID=483369 /ORGANISM="non described non described, Strain CCMP2098" /LENGTH=38 /DNA_ID= /DNA_START= /DNA_END= /DNA_ORIENTATION=